MNLVIQPVIIQKSIRTTATVREPEGNENDFLTKLAAMNLVIQPLIIQNSIKTTVTVREPEGNENDFLT